MAHALLSHGSIRVFGDREQVRFKLSSPPSAVGLDNLGSIESDALERVDGNEDDSTVCVDAMLGIAIPDCMKNLSYDALTSDGINAIGLRT